MKERENFESESDPPKNYLYFWNKGPNTYVYNESKIKEYSMF